MQLLIDRTENNCATGCRGRFLINATEVCLTLEDPVRELGPDGRGKIYGRTAIPAGRYRVTITFSPKFQKRMVLINDVPFFTGIRLHSGNTTADTLGCPLVGRYFDGDVLRGGSAAMPAIFATIDYALNAGEEVWLDVVNNFKEPLCSQP